MPPVPFPPCPVLVVVAAPPGPVDAELELDFDPLPQADTTDAVPKRTRRTTLADSENRAIDIEPPSGRKAVSAPNTASHASYFSVKVRRCWGPYLS
jgi:hypothetical protein